MAQSSAPLSALSPSDDLALRKGVRWGAVPVWNYTSDKGLSLGVLAQRFDYGDSGQAPFESVLSVQVRDSSHAGNNLWIDYQATHVGSSDLRLETEIYAFRNPEQHYYGLGAHTYYDESADRAGFYDYTEQEITVSEIARKPLWKDWEGIFGISGVSQYSLSSGEGASDSQTLYARDFGEGDHRGYYTRLFVGIIGDWRDSEFIPSKGIYFSAGTTFSPSWLGNETSWARFDADYRRYDALVEDRWLWLASQVRYAQSSPEAPLLEKARLGSWGTLRGLPISRYVSNDSLSLRSDLRSMWFRETVFKLPLKIGSGIFLDTGRIADRFTELATNPLHWAWGFSLFGSYFTDDFLGTADFGFSKEGSAYYLQLGYAF